MQMASSASSSNEVGTEKPNCATKFVSNCLLSSAFLQTPLSPPSSRHPKPNFITTIPNIIQDLHKSVSARANECFRELINSVADSHPVLHKLMCLPADFNNFRKIHCRDSGNMNSLSSHNFAAIIPGDSVAGIVVANGLTNFLNIYNSLLVVRLVLTWFPNSPPAIVSPLSTLCDPYLNIFRGIIPPLGGTLDLSPILAFLVLNAFTSTAAALPAELPVPGASQENMSSSHTSFSNLTTIHKKWMRRICRNGSKRSDDVN